MKVELNNYIKKEVLEYSNNLRDIKPKISVCVQTYNHSPYIEQCLNGILNQKTDFDFEILVGEDESTDKTRDICIEFAKKFPNKIRLFLHSRDNNIIINEKPTGKFNLMYNLQKARGEYIALCEGDDYWIDESKLQKQVDFLDRNKNFSICAHDIEIYHQDEDKITSDYMTRKVPSVTNIKELSLGNYLHTASVIFKNNLYEELPCEYAKSPVGDYFLHMLNAQYGRIKKIPEKMSIYRVHSGGTWSPMENDINKLNIWLSTICLIKNSFVRQKSQYSDILNFQIDYIKGLIVSGLFEKYNNLDKVVDDYNQNKIHNDSITVSDAWHLLKYCKKETSYYRRLTRLVLRYTRNRIDNKVRLK